MLQALSIDDIENLKFEDAHNVLQVRTLGLFCIPDSLNSGSEHLKVLRTCVIKLVYTSYDLETVTIAATQSSRRLKMAICTCIASHMHARKLLPGASSAAEYITPLPKHQNPAWASWPYACSSSSLLECATCLSLT